MEANYQQVFSTFLHLPLCKVKNREKVRYMKRDNYSVWSSLALLHSKDAGRRREKEGDECTCEGIQRSYGETASHHQVTPNLKIQRCF